LPHPFKTGLTSEMSFNKKYESTKIIFKEILIPGGKGYTLKSGNILDI
jgi:hypothetical protein